MAIVVDSVDITGMKHSDFQQLVEIFNHVMEENVRWDRQDYWDTRNERLRKWLKSINKSLEGVKIQEGK
jgi:hypothetical protein